MPTVKSETTNKQLNGAPQGLKQTKGPTSRQKDLIKLRKESETIELIFKNEE